MPAMTSAVPSHSIGVSHSPRTIMASRIVPTGDSMPMVAFDEAGMRCRAAFMKKDGSTVAPIARKSP